MMKPLAIVLVSVLGACVVGVGDAPSGGSDGTNDGAGTGTGTGNGNGNGPGTGTGNGTGTGMTATTFLEEMGKKFCDEAFSCKASFPTNAGGSFEEYFGSSPSQCYAQSAEYDMPAEVEAQIVAGTIRWNAADASACLAGITFGSCSTFWNQGPNMPPACATALVGTVADGGACIAHLECSGESSYCDEQTGKCTPDAGQ